MDVGFAIENVGEVDSFVNGGFETGNEVIAGIGSRPWEKILMFLDTFEGVKVRRSVVLDMRDILCSGLGEVENGCREVLERGEYVVQGLGDLDGDYVGELVVLVYDRVIVVFLEKDGKVKKVKVNSIAEFLEYGVLNRRQKESLEVMNVNDDDKNEVAFITSSIPGPIPPLGSLEVGSSNENAQQRITIAFFDENGSIVDTNTIGPGIGNFDVPLPTPDGGSPSYPLDRFTRVGGAAGSANTVLMINRFLWPEPGNANTFLFVELDEKAQVISWKNINQKDLVPGLDEFESFDEVWPIGGFDAGGNTNVLFWRAQGQSFLAKLSDLNSDPLFPIAVAGAAPLDTSAPLATEEGSSGLETSSPEAGSGPEVSLDPSLEPSLEPHSGMCMCSCDAKGAVPLNPLRTPSTDELDPSSTPAMENPATGYVLPTIEEFRPFGPIAADFDESERTNITLSSGFQDGFLTESLKSAQIRPGVIVINRPAPLPQPNLPLPCEALVPCYLNELTVASLSAGPSENETIPLTELSSVGLKELTFDNMTELQIGESMASLGDINGDGRQEVAITSKITQGFPSALFVLSFNSNFEAVQLAKIDLVSILGLMFQSVDANQLIYFGDPQGQFLSPRATFAIDLPAAKQELHNIGDVDEDGTSDLFLRVNQNYYILYLNSDGSLKEASESKTLQNILGESDDLIFGFPSFRGELTGSDTTMLPDLDGDGRRELAVVGFGATSGLQVFVASFSKDGAVKGVQSFGFSEINAAPIVNGAANAFSEFSSFGFLGTSAAGNPVIYLYGGANDANGGNFLELVEFDLAGKVVAVAAYRTADFIDSVTPLGDPVGDGRARALFTKLDFGSSRIPNTVVQLVDFNLAA